ncbi:oxalate:formate antiporter [Acidaminobacter sp. JC074]|uniref:nitrogenase component 1 n=1 Tax=Acidaminobacter sp. JC074 TaxID=2530199 RepID=UPI001F0D62CE|nr:nitrogenase component 1 [Acidaminobacter sp. JC074]MCH4891038.1 oxalate:formate antiporter [Acidaminobacter sp. JC074]
MSYIKYFPIPSDRMGALWTLESIEDMAVVEFGPAGTTHFAIEGLMNLNGESKAKVFTTHITERELTFGDTTNLERAIVEVDITQKPKYIFVFNSSLTSIIGIDMASVCHHLQNQTNAKLVPVETGGFKGDYTLGIREMMFTLAKNLVKEKTESKRTYNIIGCQIDEYNHISDLKEIKNMMKMIFDLECQSVFSLGSTVDQIETAANAAFNIVLRSEGLKAAEYLKKTYGTPYIAIRPYGYKASMSFIKEIEALGYESMPSKDQMVLKRIIGQFRRMEKRKLLIAGNLDAVQGMIEYFYELGFTEVIGLVNHKRPKKSLKSIQDDLLFMLSDREKEVLLDSFNPDIVLGDAVLCQLASNRGIVNKQVANPNFDQILSYDGTPYLGIRGGLYLSEMMMNLLSQVRLKKMNEDIR